MMDLVKSPLNYTGGKFLLIPQIVKLFPQKIHCFVDLFGGGFNVGVNVPQAHLLLYNDISESVKSILEALYSFGADSAENRIKETLIEYKLNNANAAYAERETAFYNLRQSYNKEPTWDKLFCLMACSFNNQIRFNQRGEFNVPYGDRGFNSSMRSNLRQFTFRMQSWFVTFHCKDFRKVELPENYFVYLDPPYFGAKAAYNGDWDYESEYCLWEYVEDLDRQGIRFALSNNLRYYNKLLNLNKDKYNIHYLTADYSNCNYQRRGGVDCEVLITNY